MSSRVSHADQIQRVAHQTRSRAIALPYQHEARESGRRGALALGARSWLAPSLTGGE